MVGVKESIVDAESMFEYDGYVAMAEACKKRAEDYQDTYEFLRAKLKYEEAAECYDRAAEIAWADHDMSRASKAEDCRNECIYQASDMLRKHVDSTAGVII